MVKGLYIPSLDGKDIFLSNNYLVNKKTGYRLRNQNGDLSLGRFINTLDYSLDLIKMREIYESVYRRRDFSFSNNKKDYTQRVINVTFKYSIKEFNKVRKGVYVKNGYCIDDLSFKNSVCLLNGELIAIETEIPVEIPLSDDVLGKWFYYDDGMYKVKPNIGVLYTVADIRSELYKNGFVCDGIKYVRFKRSSGSSRVGKCLFIDEKLYERMHKWEMCGISVKKGQDVDLAALEPYIALTLSSIIDTIQIHAENILVIDDYKSVFKDKAIATKLEDGRLVSVPEEVEISNSIWDGQSLLDSSFFGEYEEYGMLLLRGRFFKSCCFNTNIQKWFANHGIKNVSQLNGKTTAKKIQDIKLITTPSSIKYLKFGSLDDWLWTLESTFGIVKHEKPTRYFDGRMVQTHYQLLNTLQMTYEEVEKLVAPSLDYIKKIKTDPAVLRYYIKYQYCSNDDSEYPQALHAKNDIVYKLLGINDKFAQTKMYNQFKDDLVKSYIKQLRNGRILVNGNYSTLFGNPVEMLEQSIGIFDGKSNIGVGKIYSQRFNDGEIILGSRSPHVTIGNVLLAENRFFDDIKEYFNLTNEIVCVNSIGENLLERLSGSDFDSDTLLLTNNSILVAAARRNYDNFLVPTRLVNSAKRQRKYTPYEQADLDVKTSVNKIGEIINLSQELNSKLWDMLNHGKSLDEVMNLYCDIAQLDVMSNLEIDSAKKENPADNASELKRIKKKYEQRDEQNRYIRPIFFRYLDRSKGYYDTERKSYKHFLTSMDFLQKCISRYKMPKTLKSNLLNFTDVFVSEEDMVGRVNHRQIDRVINLVREARTAIIDIWCEADHVDDKSKFFRSAEKKQECVDYINDIKLGEKTMFALLVLLESEQYRDISKTMFSILFGTPNKEFFKIIEKSKTPIDMLQEDVLGEIKIFDYNFARISK